MGSGLLVPQALFIHTRQGSGIRQVPGLSIRVEQPDLEHWFRDQMIRWLFLRAERYLSRPITRLRISILRSITVEFLISQLSVSYTHLRAHETRHDLVCR